MPIEVKVAETVTFTSPIKPIFKVLNIVVKVLAYVPQGPTFHNGGYGKK